MPSLVSSLPSQGGYTLHGPFGDRVTLSTRGRAEQAAAHAPVASVTAWEPDEEAGQRFVRFLENIHWKRLAARGRWQEQTLHLGALRDALAGAAGHGPADALRDFFEAWNNAGQPDSQSCIRQAGENAAMTIRQAADALKAMAENLDERVREQTIHGNALLAEWAAGGDGVENPAVTRASLGRELAGYLDIRLDAGSAALRLSDGTLLVDEAEAVALTPEALPEAMEGGSLGALRHVRDVLVPAYAARLDALAKALIWEVNLLHCPAVEDGMEEIVSGRAVVDSTVPLGSDATGLPFGGRTGPGSLVFGLDISGDLVPVTVDVDPATDTLADLVAAMERQIAAHPQTRDRLTARADEGVLRLWAREGRVRFLEDGTGVLAALEVHGFFSGGSAADIRVAGNHGRLAAGSSVHIAALAGEIALIEDAEGQVRGQPLPTAFAELAAAVVAEAESAGYQEALWEALANDLALPDDGLAPDLGEEMAALMRFEHAYKAAAKLILSSESMLKTILGYGFASARN